MSFYRYTHLIAALAAVGLLATTAGCPAAGQGQGRDHRLSASRPLVNPNACGNYATVDVGRKVKAFLTATVRLHRAVKDTEEALRATCVNMARPLGIPTTGAIGPLCKQVADTIKQNLATGLKANARMDVKYEPAVCTVNVQAAASAAARCEARAEADIGVSCKGTCQGTCNGGCDGTCAGAAGGGGAAGQCNGQCSGQCSGTCTGTCQGHAEVDADAACKVDAEVSANVEAKCTEPELTVNVGADIVVDTAKIAAAVDALKIGLPRILMIQARMKGPLWRAYTTWVSATNQLAKATPDFFSALGEQSVCVISQIAGAAKMIADIKVSVEVQVEVSASVSASAGAGGGTR